MNDQHSAPNEIVIIAGRQFVIERIAAFGGNLFGCGILPLRRNKADLIRDIERSQGPEWRGGNKNA